MPRLTDAELLAEIEATSPASVAWHYTSGDRLQAILRSGVLRPTAAGSWGPAERPAVWFSRRRDWDPATNLGRTASAEEIDRVNAACRRGGVRAAVEASQEYARFSPVDVGGIARIGVAPETAPYTWQDFVRMSGVPASHAEAREDLDRRNGSDPADWRVSFAPVPSAEWLRVEWRSGVRPGERWEPVSGWPPDARARDRRLGLRAQVLRRLVGKRLL